MDILNIAGILTKNGDIEFKTMKTIGWSQLTNDPIPDALFGDRIEVTVSLIDDELISGKNGIVWATYDIRQAEIIRDALLSLHINTEMETINLPECEVYLIKVSIEKEAVDAIDYIWKSKSGLRLKPDWSYPDGERNKSFELWLSGC